MKEEHEMSVERAIEHIHAEMEEKNNSYVRAVGGFLKDYLKIDPGAAENILVDGKSITKSIQEMRKEAEKNKVDNVAVLTDTEGFEIVLKYYGIDPVDPHDAKEADAFDVNLDDFL